MRNRSSRAGVARVAERQRGRISWAQIRALGIDRAVASRWLRDGYLHPRLPRVYAVGHATRSTESDLAEALLYAGPGAMLSHATAAWWLGVLDEQPSAIHVSTPRQVRSLPGIVVHKRRACERIWHKRLPTTTLPQALVDLAVRAPLRTIRRALAKADYAESLDIAEIEALLVPRPAGAAKLRTALTEHRPDLARTKSKLELAFAELCEEAGFPPPEINVYVQGWEVDALWREQRIAVELDGYRNHRSPAQVKRDRRKELALRAASYTPLRYSEEQLTQNRAEVIADLRRVGVR